MALPFMKVFRLTSFSFLRIKFNATAEVVSYMSAYMLGGHMLWKRGRHAFSSLFLKSACKNLFVWRQHADLFNDMVTFLHKHHPFPLLLLEGCNGSSSLRHWKHSGITCYGMFEYTFRQGEHSWLVPMKQGLPQGQGCNFWCSFSTSTNWRPLCQTNSNSQCVQLWYTNGSRERKTTKSCQTGQLPFF